MQHQVALNYVEASLASFMDDYTHFALNQVSQVLEVLASDTDVVVVFSKELFLEAVAFVDLVDTLAPQNPPPVSSSMVFSELVRFEGYIDIIHNIYDAVSTMHEIILSPHFPSLPIGHRINCFHEVFNKIQELLTLHQEFVDLQASLALTIRALEMYQSEGDAKSPERMKRKSERNQRQYDKYVLKFRVNKKN